MNINIYVGYTCFVFHAEELCAPYTTFHLKEISPAGTVLEHIINSENQQELFGDMADAVRQQFQLESRSHIHSSVQIRQSVALLMTVRLQKSDFQKFSPENTVTVEDKEKYWRKGRKPTSFSDTYITEESHATRGGPEMQAVTHQPPVYSPPAASHSLFVDVTATSPAVLPPTSEPPIQTTSPQNIRAEEKRRRREELKQQYRALFSRQANLNDNEFAQFILGEEIFTKITRGSKQLPPGELADWVIACRQHFQSLYQSEFAVWLDPARIPPLNNKEEKKAYKRAMRLMAHTKNFFEKITSAKGPVLPEGTIVSEYFYYKNILKAKRKCVENYRDKILELGGKGKLFVAFCTLVGGFIGSTIGTIIGFVVGAFVMGTLGSVVPVAGNITGVGIGGTLGSLEGAVVAGGTGAVAGALAGKFIVGAFAGWSCKAASSALFFKHIDCDPVNTKFKHSIATYNGVFDAGKRYLAAACNIAPLPNRGVPSMVSVR